MKSNQRRNWFPIVSSILMAFMIGEIIFLAYQNRELKHLLSTTTPIADFQLLKKGDHVEPIHLRTLSGDTLGLSYSDSSRKYLLFVLSTTCPHCEANLAKWDNIVRAHRSSNVYIVGISVHDSAQTVKFVQDKHVGFFLMTVKDPAGFLRKYKIGGVPETILIDGYGVVEQEWVGELTDEQAKEIEHLLDHT